jgi:hypothetical protein
MPSSDSGEKCSSLPGEIEHAFLAVLLRHGATSTPALEERVARCVVQLREALRETERDGRSLSPLDVARIRFGKFAATVLSPAVFRDPHTLAQLRADVAGIARDFVGPAGTRGSRFGP